MTAGAKLERAGWAKAAGGTWERTDGAGRVWTARPSSVRPGTVTVECPGLFPCPITWGAATANAVFAAHDPDTPPDRLRHLWNRSDVDSRAVRQVILCRADCPVGLLNTALRSPDSPLYFPHVAVNPNLPDTAVRQWVESTDPTMRAAVACSAKLPDDLAEQLASDEHSYVRENVAANPAVPDRIRAVAALA